MKKFTLGKQTLNVAYFTPVYFYSPQNAVVLHEIK